MGNCVCCPGPPIDTEPDTTVIEPEPEPEPPAIETIKFVLLGAGDSGKSTLFKQMTFNYAKDFSEDNLMEHRDRIIKSIYISFSDYLTAVRKLNENVIEDAELLRYSEELFPSALTSQQSYPKLITEPAKKLMQAVWTSEAGKETWKTHERYPITDSLNYFMENLERFSDLEYKPIKDDFLKARIQTTGIFERTFIYKGVTMTVVDVGGQRAERKKWLQAIDGCTAVLFVTSLSGFNQNLFEDHTVMRLPESLQLFKKTFNFLPFRISEVPFVLFMNKEDLFIEKLRKMEEQGKSLDDYFPELGLGTNYDGAVEKIKEHIKNQFLGMVNEQQRRRVIPHYITATDNGIFLKIFQAAAQVILRRALTAHFNPEAE